MKEKEILENLCHYDKRSPYYDKEPEDLDVTGNHACFCDNCFYGKAKLAEYILKLLENGKTGSNTGGDSKESP